MVQGPQQIQLRANLITVCICTYIVILTNSIVTYAYTMCIHLWKELCNANYYKLCPPLLFKAVRREDSYSYIKSLLLTYIAKIHALRPPCNMSEYRFRYENRTMYAVGIVQRLFRWILISQLTMPPRWEILWKGGEGSRKRFSIEAT